MINKVGKATRFGKDLQWWYNTGKNLYDKGKDIYKQYFTNTAPLFRHEIPLNNIVNDYLRKKNHFYVCFNKRKRVAYGTPVLTWFVMT